MNKLVDSHCHLSMLGENQDEIGAEIKKARDNGVHILQNISVNLEEFERNQKYCQEDDLIYTSVGLHPLYCDRHIFDYAKAESFLKYKGVNAIGECGLDYSRELDANARRTQQAAFLMQIDMAAKHDLALIIHMRAAEDQTYHFLRHAYMQRQIKGVMHCFTGTKDLAFKMLDCGFYISFSGVITFKKKVENLCEMIKDIPLERILVETDSPYLTPEPYRGQKNGPAYVTLVAKKIAEIKCITYEEVCEQTTKNYKNLFMKSL